MTSLRKPTWESGIMDKNNIKISVIIPVFNVEKYLARALDSIILQTYENLEIICVNDGSTDSSLQILQEYAERDKRILIINQANKGCGAARNTGMSVMSGDYFTFIDSDDWVQLGAYEKFINILKKEERTIDIFLFNGFLYIQDENLKTALSFKAFNVADWGDFKQSHFKTIREHKSPFNSAVAVWNKLYRTEWYRQHNFLFADRLIGEDRLFSTQTYMSTDNVYVLEDYLYCYRQQPASLCHTMNENIFDLLSVMEQVKDIYIENNLFDKNKYSYFEDLLRTGMFCLSHSRDDLCKPLVDKLRKLLQAVVPEFETDTYKRHKYYQISEDILNLSSEEICAKYRKSAA